MRLVPGLAVRAGQTIAGKYRVEGLLGAGASGIVLSARSIHLREAVVLKILASYTDDQEAVVQRRMVKARLAARLQSEHVARIVDLGVTEEGMPYVASECLLGSTLEVELEERGPLPVAEAVRWVLEACEGLAEAHAMGLVHGDLKPQNVFLSVPTARPRGRRRSAGDEIEASADPRVLKLLDFGTTSPLDGIGDQSASAFFGSPAFLAPEQIQDPTHVGTPADVWALGVLLYNLVSGSLPFTADTVSGVIVAVVYDAPSFLTEAPYELAKIVASCLAKDPAKRPRDVKALAAALAPFAGASGARLSDRVATMLDAPPPVPQSDPLADASGSIEPVSMPMATVRLAADGPTRPSRRLVATRRMRWRRALGLIAAASFGLGGWAATRHGDEARGAPSMEQSTTTLTSQEVTGSALVPTLPSTEVSIPVNDLPTGAIPVTDLPPISFAPSADQPSTPTPRVVMQTLLVAASPPTVARVRAPAVPPALLTPTPRHPPTAPTMSVAPAPRGAIAPARGSEPARGGAPAARLPVGLPTSREPTTARESASPPRVPAPRSPAQYQTQAAAARNTPPPIASSTTDASYLRSLFTERK